METYFGKPEENNLSDDINEALAAELLKGKTYNSENFLQDFTLCGTL